MAKWQSFANNTNPFLLLIASTPIAGMGGFQPEINPLAPLNNLRCQAAFDAPPALISQFKGFSKACIVPLGLSRRDLGSPQRLLTPLPNDGYTLTTTTVLNAP